MKVPSGTPSTLASARPVNINATALARLSCDTSDAATTDPMPKNEPCANDVTTRAIMRQPGATAHRTLPTMKIPISRSAHLRGIRLVRTASSGAPTATPSA